MSDTFDKQPDDHSDRDAASLRVLALFFVILGALVLVGTLWEGDNLRAIVVNVGSGVVLIAVGVGMFAIAKRISGRKGEQSHAHQPASADQDETTNHNGE